MKALFTLILVAFFSSINAQAPTFVWGNGFTGTGSDQLVDFAYDSHGNIIGVGRFEKTLYLNPKNKKSDTVSSYINKKSMDIFIVKYSSNGNLIWKYSMGGSKSDIIRSIKLDASDNIYLLGEFSDSMDVDVTAYTKYLNASGKNSNVFLAKYDKDFLLQWAFNLGTNDFVSYNYVNAKCLELDMDGNIYISGTFRDLVDFDPSAFRINYLKSNRGTDVFIAKYTTNGDYVWAKQFGKSNTTSLSEPIIKIDSKTNNLFFAAMFSGSIDMNPSAAIDTISSNSKVNINYTDFFIAKYDTACNYKSARAYGGASPESLKDFDIDENGNLYIAGNFYGVADFNPGANKDTLVSVMSYNVQYPAPSNDVFIAKYSSSGNYSWAKKIGRGGNDYATKLDVTPNGTIYLAGYFSDDSVDFNASNAPNDVFLLSTTPDLKGNIYVSDLFVTSYTSTGDFIWAGKLGGYSYEYDAFVKVGRNNSLYIAGGINASPKIDLNFSPTDSSIFTKSSISGYGDDFFLTKYSYCYVNSNVTASNGVFTAEESRSGAKYTWIDYTTMLPIPNANSKTFTPTTNGNYICAISFNDCTDTSDVLQMKSVALYELTSNSIVSIFPNPSKNSINITIQSKNISESPKKLEVIDVLGKEVMSIAIEKNSTNSSQLVDVSNIKSGLYFIKLNSSTVKFIKE